MIIHVDSLFCVNLVQDCNNKFLKILSRSERTLRRLLICEDCFKYFELLPLNHYFSIKQTQLHFSHLHVNFLLQIKQNGKCVFYDIKVNLFVLNCNYWWFIFYYIPVYIGIKVVFHHVSKNFFWLIEYFIVWQLIAHEKLKYWHKLFLNTNKLL